MEGVKRKKVRVVNKEKRKREKKTKKTEKQKDKKIVLLSRHLFIYLFFLSKKRLFS